MKEPKHDIAYFLTNPNFIAWIANPTENNAIFWKTWLKNHPEDREEFYNAKAILERTDFKTSKVPKNRQEEILENILSKKASSHFKSEIFFKTGIVTIRPWLLGSAAAIVLVLVAIFSFWDTIQDFDSESLPTISIITKESPRGEKTSFCLPDGTKVMLNAGSMLSYPSQFEVDSRKVTLVGEAYFDVRHNAHKKFLVKSGDIITSVHGTAFNVRAYKEGPISVSLERGSVSVYSQSNKTGGKSFKIIPGEKLTVNNDFNQSKKSFFDHVEEFGWKEGILVFKDADLKTFIALMERWYAINISVVGKKSENWGVNGRFNNQSLENVMKSLEFSREVRYMIKGKQVTIYLKNNY